MKLQVIPERELVYGQRVLVYYNLHKHVYSIRDKATGLVVAYADTVVLTEALFKVSEAGRQRVLREKRKNVHAFVEGLYAGTGENLQDMHWFSKAYYNPYTTETFIDKDNGKALIGANIVVCKDKQAYYQNGKFA